MRNYLLFTEALLALLTMITFFGGVGCASVSMTDKIDAYITQLSSRNAQDRYLAAHRLLSSGDPRAVAPLIAMLDGKDERMHSEIMSGLTSIATPSLLPRLVTMLKENDPMEIEHVKSAFWVVGKPAVEPLIAALKSDDVDLRKNAIYILVRIGDNSAVPALREILENPDDPVWLSALCALGELHHEPAVDPLIAAFEDRQRSEYQRSWLAGCLGRLGDKRATAALLKAIDDKDPSVRTAVISALGIAKDSRAVRPLLDLVFHPDNEIAKSVPSAFANMGGVAVEPILQALDDKNPSVRMAACAVSAQIVDQRLVMPLIRAVNDEDRLVAEFAIKALGPQNDPAAVPALAASLRDESADIKLAAVEALGKIHDGSSCVALSSAVSDPNAEVRLAAVKALENIGDRSSSGYLIPALKDESSFVRVEAVKTLGKMRNIHAVPGLIDLLADPSPDVRYYAVEALGELKARAAVTALVAAINDEDRLIWESAIQALGKIGDRRAVEPLLSILGDNNRGSLALHALGAIGDRSAVEPLISVLKSSNASSAALALGEIGDKRAIAPLLAIANDDENKAHWAALYALSRLKVGAAVHGISAMLDGDYFDRCDAAWYLAEIGDAAAAGYLMAGLKNWNLEIVCGAAQFYIRHGISEAVAPLIDALDERDSFSIVVDESKGFAEELLASGQPELVDTARKWSASRPWVKLDDRPEDGDLDHYAKWGELRNNVGYCGKCLMVF